MPILLCKLGSLSHPRFLQSIVEVKPMVAWLDTVQQRQVGMGLADLAY